MFVWQERWSTISREAWLQLKCDSTESDAAGLQILALPVVSRRKQGKAHVFLDWTLPEQVNTYAFSHRYIKSDCKHVCVKDVFHIYTHGAQKSRLFGCVSTKTWERACVSSWKYQNGKGTRLCFQLSFTILLGNAYVLKTCFFVFPQDWNPLLFFLLKLTRTAVFARNSSHAEIKS